MKKFLTIAVTFICCSFYSQVTLQTNLPPRIAPNSTIDLEVKISKGSISSFSKYQVDVPAGVTIKEGDSKTGNFTFEDQRAKIVWVSLPNENEFVVSFKMAVKDISGPGTFLQKFFFVDDGGKKEIEAEPLSVEFDPSGATTTTSFPVTKSSVASNNSNAVPKENTSSNAGSGSENKTTVAETKSPVESPAETVVKNTAPAENKTSPPVETKSPAPVQSKTTPPVESKTSSGLVYRIQLGAYGADPGKSRFASAGKVSVSKEDGLYKVLFGSYESKQEALQQIENLKSKGFDGFLVKYQNGQRVK